MQVVVRSCISLCSWSLELPGRVGPLGSCSRCSSSCASSLEDFELQLAGVPLPVFLVKLGQLGCGGQSIRARTSMQSLLERDPLRLFVALGVTLSASAPSSRTTALRRRGPCAPTSRPGRRHRSASSRQRSRLSSGSRAASRSARTNASSVRVYGGRVGLVLVWGSRGSASRPAETNDRQSMVQSTGLISSIGFPPRSSGWTQVSSCGVRIENVVSRARSCWPRLGHQPRQPPHRSGTGRAPRTEQFPRK